MLSQASRCVSKVCTWTKMRNFTWFFQRLRHDFQFGLMQLSESVFLFSVGARFSDWHHSQQVQVVSWRLACQLSPRNLSTVTSRCGTNTSSFHSCCVQAGPVADARSAMACGSTGPRTNSRASWAPWACVLPSIMCASERMHEQTQGQLNRLALPPRRHGSAVARDIEVSHRRPKNSLPNVHMAPVSAAVHGGRRKCSVDAPEELRGQGLSAKKVALEKHIPHENVHH